MSPEKLEIELERLRAMKEYEYSFLSKENVVIAGVDEAGRGPLAGPVVAAAAILNVDDDFIYLNDSKKVTPKRRDILYNDIMNRTIYGIGIVSAEEIDEMNILQATYKAMRMAIDKLSKRPEVLLNDAVIIPGIDESIHQEIFRLAEEIKEKFYGNRIVLFAPLYLSNYCINGCKYCPYHGQNKHISRKKLTQEQIRQEVTALQDMGHKRLAIEAGEDPKNNPIEYILECIDTIYSIKHKNGAIRRVNVNIAATTVENYKKLKDAGIGTYILFQETYNKEAYEDLHPSGPKSDYAYHTEAMDRAMEAGIDDVGCGVLFGLNLYKYDFVGILMHAKHLEDTFGCGPHTISVPRVRPADDIDPDTFDNGVPDEVFKRIIAILRIAVPYTGIIMSTRESKAMRGEAVKIGVSQISGGSRTSVGGYVEEEAEDDNSAQFDVNDTRTLNEVVDWLLDLGHVPSFCTACYREGRTGDRFMSLVKSGQIANICQPNALMTLKEYLEDYATEETKEKGLKVIQDRLAKIPNETVRAKVEEHLHDLEGGMRDFRF